jgi:hypothetical protein
MPGTEGMPILVFLFFWSLVLSAPVILALVVGRRRINRAAGCALVAMSFAAASSYKIWQMEWFDVWRHGVPGASLLIIYGLYAAVYGAIGWFIAKAILRNGSSVRRVREN